MLQELFLSLRTPCSPYVRHMGYLAETIAMQKRYQRNRAAWQPHLDLTRAFLLTCAERCEDRGSVVILGSGLLLDVPLPELASRFREVILKDVVCLPEARRTITKYPNVRFKEYDVTNIAGQLWNNRQTGVNKLPQSRPGGEKDAGLVVSLNILSQLWVIPRAYVTQMQPPLPEDKIEEWCRSIVEAHHAWLRSQTCDVCLVADHAFIKRDRQGTVISKGSSVYGLDLLQPDEEWTWNIAPINEENRHTSKELIVGAWRFAQGRDFSLRSE